MDLNALNELPPWEWPENAGEMIRRILEDKKRLQSDRVLAARLAGEFVVACDDIHSALLAILEDNAEAIELRGRAAIALGPALEHADTDGFDDPDEMAITESMFRKVQETLRRLYMDAAVPKEVRRRILEASVRAPQDWHQNAVRAAYSSDDGDWKLTAVFCMKYIRGFDSQILESLESSNTDIHFQAIGAAGNWELADAWPHITELVSSEQTEKYLLLAAIEAAACIRPNEAEEVLGDLLDSDDEDIIDAVEEALAMAGVAWDGDEEDDADDESGS
jgi:hypothetical protein